MIFWFFRWILQIFQDVGLLRFYKGSTGFGSVLLGFGIRASSDTGFGFFWILDFNGFSRTGSWFFQGRGSGRFFGFTGSWLFEGSGLKKEVD